MEQSRGIEAEATVGAHGREPLCRCEGIPTDMKGYSRQVVALHGMQAYSPHRSLNSKSNTDC